MIPMTSIYDFSLENQQGEEISLSHYQRVRSSSWSIQQQAVAWPTAIPRTARSLPALPGKGARNPRHPL